MENKTEKNMERIRALAREDTTYKTLLAQCKVLEARFDKGILPLEPEDRALLWEFVMLTEIRCIRKLELACEYMEFPEIKPDVP